MVGQPASSQFNQSLQKSYTQVTFRIRFPGGEQGAAARALRPEAVKKSHDRLRPAGRTVEVGTPIATRIE